MRVLRKRNGGLVIIADKIDSKKNETENHYIGIDRMVVFWYGIMDKTPIRYPNNVCFNKCIRIKLTKQFHRIQEQIDKLSNSHNPSFCSLFRDIVILEKETRISIMVGC